VSPRTFVLLHIVLYQHLFLYANDYVMDHWWNIKWKEINVSYHYFVHRKSLMENSGTKPGILWREVGD